MSEKLKAAARYFEAHQDDRRLHSSRSALIKPYTVTELLLTESGFSFKPRHGLWYSIGPSWIEWCLSEMPEMVHDYLHEFTIDEGRILTLKSPEDLDAFTEKYKVGDGDKYPARFCETSIDWRRVCKEYAGIEIAPYQYGRRLELMWYYGWDCASGVLWDMAALRSCRLVAKYSEKRKRYVECLSPSTI